MSKLRKPRRTFTTSGNVVQSREAERKLAKARQIKTTGESVSDGTPSAPQMPLAQPKSWSNYQTPKTNNQPRLIS